MGRYKWDKRIIQPAPGCRRRCGYIFVNGCMVGWMDGHACVHLSMHMHIHPPTHPSIHKSIHTRRCNHVVASELMAGRDRYWLKNK